MLLVVLLSEAPLLWAAWRANRRTTLMHALVWVGFAWAAWLWWAVEGALGSDEAPVVRYGALCLTGCAGMAVLGARRPGASAWSFVVLGLLAVLLRPLLEGLGELRLQAPHLLFLALPLVVPVVNYLPTRLGPAALLLGVGCALELARLAGMARDSSVGPLLVALTPWLAWAVLRRGRRAAPGPFDSLWLGFRDRFGLVWAQRVREQFNRAAANADWPVVLSWKGLRTAEGKQVQETPEQMAALRALLKRFSLETPAAEEDPARKPG
jgi:hypothetical protein